MTDSTTLYLAAGLLVAGWAAVFIFDLSAGSKSKWLRSQPWVGLQKQWFASFRAGLNSVKNTRVLLLEGYEKFGKNEKPFVLPQMGSDPLIILPADKVHEFLTQGDDKVDYDKVRAESIGAKWTMAGQLSDDSHFDVVRRQLTRRLPLLTADVYSELVLAMQHQWPVGDQWMPVKAYPTCMKIVSRAANRVFSGKELCRNPEYLEHSRLYAQSVFTVGGLAKTMPRFLKDIVARYAMRDVNKHTNICKKLSMPIVKERLRKMEEQGKSYEPENDVLQWMLDDALASSDAYRRDPNWICQFLLVLNMVAIHTTSIVTTCTLLDVYSSPHADEIVAGLREEAARVLEANGGRWTKDAVNQLFRIDSAIREAMRYSGLNDIGVPRMVKKPEGIDLSGGIHLPHGVRVAVPARAIHHDEAFYPKADEYDAFRFSRPQEAYAKQKQEQASQQEDGETGHLKKVLEHKNRGLIVTTDDFFSFGFGKHACPGRFFASQEMKLMLAHIVLNYDIKIDGGRPKDFQINGMSVPTEDAEMQVRLRQT